MIVLSVRLRCLGCNQAERVTFNILESPEEWMRCPRCGPLEMVEQREGKTTARISRRRSNKGGVTLVARPIG